MDAMKVVRLLVSAGAVLILAVALVVVASMDGDKSTIAVLGAALTVAVQNLMSQISTETAATSAKAAAVKVEQVVETAKTEAAATAAATTRDVLADSVKQESLVPDGRRPGPPVRVERP